MEGQDWAADMNSGKDVEDGSVEISLSGSSVLILAPWV